MNDVNQVKEKRLIGSFQGQGIPLEQIHELTVVHLSTSAGAGVRRYKMIWRSSPVDQPTEHVRVGDAQVFLGNDILRGNDRVLIDLGGERICHFSKFPHRSPGRLRHGKSSINHAWKYRDGSVEDAG